MANQSVDIHLFDLVCNKTKHIVGASHFVPMMYLQLLLGLVSIPPNMASMILVWKVSIFHIDLRILLAHFSFHLLWNSVGLVIKILGTLKALYTDPCDLVTPAEECRWQEVFLTSKSSVSQSLLVLLLERCLAAVRSGGPPGVRQRPWLSLILVSLTWMFLVYIQLVGGAWAKLLPICESLMSLNAYSARAATTSALGTESAILVMTIFVWVYNKKKLQGMAINRAKYNLNRRFHIDQNIQINRILVPTMILHVVCYIPNFTLLFLILSELDMTDEMKTWFVHLSYLLKMIHGLAHPILAFQRNPHMRKQLVRYIPKVMLTFMKGRVKPVEGLYRQSVVESRAHFEMLEKMWHAKA